MASEDSLDGTAPSQAAERELRLQRIVGRCIDRLTGGESIDPAQVLAEEPELGPEVLKELETFLGLGSPESGGAPLGKLGDYEIRREIGRGGAGIVYEAWQQSMARRVALKVLSAGLAAEPKSLLRFLREARTAGQLSHPNLVSVHAMGAEKGQPYIVLEFVEGETLARMLQRLRGSGTLPATFEVSARGSDGTALSPLDPDDVDLQYCLQAAKAFAGAAEGLSHAHSRGIVHRDLKPSNLILDLDGRLRILDFGLARQESLETITGSGELVGTPLYMSPEHARGGDAAVGPRSDIYSLGATLYEVLALEPSIQGKSHQDILQRIQTVDPRPLRAVRPRVPRDLETIVMKCLEKNPEDRYGTAEALAQDLRRFVRGDAVEARERSRWQLVTRKLMRHRLRVALAVTAMLLLLCLAWLGHRELESGRRQAITRYEASVLRSALRLELASLAQKAEAGESSFFGTSPLWGGTWYEERATDFAGSADRRWLEDVSNELHEADRSLPGRPDARYHRLRALVFLGREQEALVGARELEREQPGFAPGLLLQAAILERRKDFTGAESIRKRLAELPGGSWARGMLDAERSLREGRWRDATDACSRLLDLDAGGRDAFIGSSILTRLQRGRAYLAAKEYGSALSDFTIVRHLAPGSVEPSLLEGKVLHLLGLRDEAEARFRTTLSQTRTPDEVALAVASIYSSLGDERKTLEWEEKVQTDGVRERRRTWTLWRLGRNAEAIAAGRKAIDLTPDDPRAFDALAWVLNFSRRSAEVPALLDKPLRRWPRNGDLHQELGISFQFRGMIDEATREYEECLKLYPDGYSLGYASSRLAGCYFQQGRFQEGRMLHQKARAMSPLDGELVYYEGLDHLEHGFVEDAIPVFEHAIAMDPSFALPHAFRGCALEMLGREEEAVEEYRRAGSLYPRNERLHLQLGGIHLRRGRLDEALGEYARVLEFDPASTAAHSRIVRAARSDPAPPAAALERILSVLEKDPAEPAQSPIVLNTVAVLASRLPDGTSLPRALDRLSRTIGSSSGPAEVFPLIEETWSDLLPELAPRRDVFLELRARSKGEDARMRLQYVEARFLERSGNLSEAAEKLRGLLAGGTEWAEPYLSLARILRAQGKAQEAEKALRTGLGEGLAERKEAWDQWAAIALAGLKLTPREAIEALPGPECRHREDLSWLLKRLDAGDPIRTRCGGDDYLTPGGEAWSRDRCFRGGKSRKISYPDAIAGTESDFLYRTERWFPDPGPWCGYAFPLPRGRFRVALHFAETHFRRQGLRRFDVFLQGKRLLEDFEPLGKGFATAIREVFDVEVPDGLLEISFVHGREAPLVSAIEITRVD